MAIKILNDKIEFKQGEGFDKSRVWVEYSDSTTKRRLSPDEFGFIDFNPNLLDIEQTVRIIYTNKANELNMKDIKVTVTSSKEEIPRPTAKKALASGILPATPTHTSVAVSVIGENGGIYSKGGINAVSVGTKKEDMSTSGWNVYYVDSQGNESIISDDMWEITEMDTSHQGTSIVEIAARYGGNEYTCSRALTVTDINGSDMTIITEDIPDGVVGESYYCKLEAIGGTPPYTWFVDGLPHGFTFEALTGIISCSRVEVPIGKYTVAATVTDSDSNAVASHDYVMEVRGEPQPEGKAPHIITTKLPNAKQGDEYETEIAVEGFRPMEWTCSPLLSDLDIDKGVIFGIPKVEFNGKLTVTAKNEYGEDTAEISFRVEGSRSPAKILTTALPDAWVDKSYKCQIDALGTEPMMWSIDGLPKGLMMSNVTGSIYGQPTISGEYLVKITAVNGYGQDSKSYYMTVHPRVN